MMKGFSGRACALVLLREALKGSGRPLQTQKIAFEFTWLAEREQSFFVQSKVN